MTLFKHTEQNNTQQAQQISNLHLIGGTTLWGKLFFRCLGHRPPLKEAQKQQEVHRRLTVSISRQESEFLSLLNHEKRFHPHNAETAEVTIFYFLQGWLREVVRWRVAGVRHCQGAQNIQQNLRTFFFFTKPTDVWRHFSNLTNARR